MIRDSFHDDPPSGREARAQCVDYLRERSKETADERWERYQRLDAEMEEMEAWQAASDKALLADEAWE